MFTSLVEEANLGYEGQVAAGRQLQRVWLLGLDGFGAASNAASHSQVGHGCPSTAQATVAPCAGPPHP
jgi:hypothetical protein